MLRTNLNLAQKAISLQKQKNPGNLDVSRFVAGVVNLWSADPDDLFAEEDNKEPPAIILNDMKLDADLIGILGQALAERNKGFQHTFLYNVPLKQEEFALLVDALSAHRNLEGIVLSQCELSDNCTSDLLKLNACTSSLDLSHNQLTSNGAAALCAWEGRLDLSYNRLDSTFIKELIILIRSKSLKLSYLDISGNDFKDEDKIELQKALKDSHSRCVTIIETNVKAQFRFENEITKLNGPRKHDVAFAGACNSRMVNIVIKSLVSNASQELSIVNHVNIAQKIIEDTARAVVVLTCKDQGLSELHLGWQQLSDRGLEVISASLAKGAMVKSLNISRVDQQNESLSVNMLAHLLQTLPGSCLLSLNLDGQELTDEHAELIAMFLEKNPALQALSMRNNRMTDAGINTIMQALSSNNSLKELDLTGGAYTNAGARAIVKMMDMNCSLLSVKCGMLNDENMTALTKSVDRNKTINDMPAREKANALRKIVNNHPDMPQANRENLLNLAVVPSLKTLAADEVEKLNRQAMEAIHIKIAAKARNERLQKLIQFTIDNCSAALTVEDVNKIITCGGKAGLIMGWWQDGFETCNSAELLNKLKDHAIDDAKDSKDEKNETLDILNRILAPKKAKATKDTDKGKEEAPDQTHQQAAFSSRLETLRINLNKALSEKSNSYISIVNNTHERVQLINALKKNKDQWTVDDFIAWRKAIEDDLKTVPADFPYTKHNGGKKVTAGEYNKYERERYLHGLNASLRLVNTFQSDINNIKFFSQDNHQFAMPNLEVTELSLPKLQYLRESIQNLSDYCASIHDGGKSKNIADALTTQLKRLRCRTYTKDFKEATIQMFNIYNDNIEYLAQRRDNNIKHILVNVFLALSVIGFIAQVINKATTGNMFFFFDSETTRRKLAVKVIDAVNKLDNNYK